MFTINYNDTFNSVEYTFDNRNHLDSKKAPKFIPFLARTAVPTLLLLREPDFFTLPSLYGLRWSIPPF